MSDESKHINPRFDFSANPPEAFPRTHIDWGKSKDEIWAELERKMEDAAPVRIRTMGSPWIRIAMAAAIALLIGLTVLLQSYKKTITIPAGLHGSIILPDQSHVQLNAQTTLSYKPLLWRFSRKVKLDGEAFFEVTPGRKFEVISNPGKTVVLGTSFNIYSRESDYRVVCVTGKVKVTESMGNREVVIKPGEQATLSEQGTLDVHSDFNAIQTISWIENKMSFTSVPLRNVLEEIGRQYGIIIQIPKDLNYTYTGTFMRNSSADQTLDMVCKPFDLKCSQISKDEYVITHGN